MKGTGQIARWTDKRLALGLLLNLRREYSSASRRALQAVTEYLCNRSIFGNVRPAVCGIRRRSWRERRWCDRVMIRRLWRVCERRDYPLSLRRGLLFTRNKSLKSGCRLFTWRFVFAVGDQINDFSGQRHDVLIAVVRLASQETIALGKAKGTLLRFASKCSAKCVKRKMREGKVCCVSEGAVVRTW